MSCDHLEETRRHIQKIVQKIYPELQYRFVLIGSYSNFETGASDNPFTSELLVLANELKSVFHTLITYETELVFPSVLKYFDNNGAEVKGQLPDITELLSTTKAKEKQLLKLCDEVSSRLQKTGADQLPQKENIALIVSFLQNDFKKTKEQWNEMLKDRMNNCACFRLIRFMPKASSRTN